MARIELLRYQLQGKLTKIPSEEALTWRSTVVPPSLGGL